MLNKKHIRRIVAIDIVLLLVFALVPSSFGISHSEYNASAALSYAKSHWNDHSGGPVNFVSKCLQAGGLYGPTSENAGSLVSYLTSYTSLQAINLPLDENGYATRSLDLGVLATGDIVFQYCSAHGEGPLMFLCSGYDSQGYALFYAHINTSTGLNNSRFKLNAVVTPNTANCNIEAKVIRLSTLKNHNYIYASTTAPTCTENGYTTYRCTICGDTIITNTIPPLGHDFHVTSVVAPTLTKTGRLTVECSRRDASMTYTLPTLNTTDYIYQVLSAPTCGSSGTGRYRWKNTEYGQFYFDVTIPATGEHTYSWTSCIITTTPTEISPGELKATCSVCNSITYIMMPIVSATDYTFTVTKAATCQEDGVERITWNDTTYGTISFTRPIEKLGHAYYGTVTSPTCSEQGFTTYTCSRCGDVYTQDYTAALGHDYQNGVCTRCGEADPDYTEPLAFGDLDGDGDVAAADAVLMARYLVDLVDLTEEQRLAADITHDGDITSADAILLARFLVGYVDNLETAPKRAVHLSQKAAVITAGKISGEKGTVVTVPVIISGNPGFAGFTLQLDYPEQLELTAISKGSLLKASESGSFMCSPENRLVNWCDISNISADGELLRLTFRITGDHVENCQVILAVKNGKKSNLVDEDGQAVTLNPFADMPAKEHWAYDAINWAIDNRITSGTTATTFSPDAACTRAQVLTFLWRAFGEPEPTSGDNPFEDVRKDAYYYDAVLWAVENGITTGTSDNAFSPDNLCTRAQVVTFLWRYNRSPMTIYQDHYFGDIEAGAYYETAIRWACENSIVFGISPTEYKPNSICTRAHVITLLYRSET